MSELPKGWENVKGEQIFQLIRGVSYNKSDVSSEPANGLIPILRANNIQDGDIIPDDLVYVPTKYVSQNQLLRPGDILIATSSGSRSVVGKTALALPEHCEFAFGAFCAVARPQINDHSRWLYYHTQSEDYRHYVERVALGININNFRTADLSALPLPIPPLTEQRRIVAKLDSLFARTRRAREELNQIPRLIEHYKQAILAAAFRGDLTADWRAENPISQSGEDLREILLKRHAKAMELQSMGSRIKQEDSDLSAVNLLPELPETWTWIPVSKIATKVVDGVHKKPIYIDDGIPFLTVKNLTAGQNLDFNNCKYVSQSDHDEFIKRTHPEKGDILISKDGTLGVTRAVRTDQVFSIFVSVALVKPVDRGMTDYLELAFQSPHVQEQMTGVGTGLQHIHLVDLRRDLIPVAPEQERKEIICRINTAFNRIDKLASETERATILLGHFDQVNLAKAFQGVLVPQDPNDEPASALLARIRAERDADISQKPSKRSDKAIREKV